VNESRSAPRAKSRRSARIVVRLNFSAYPLQASLGPLGRKWAMLVLMNIALSRAQRFNELLRRTPGMSKRILAIRLRELEAHGFIFRAEQGRLHTRWQLTAKGADVLPVLLTLIHFGSRHRPPGVPAHATEDALDSTFRVSYGVRRPDGRRASSAKGGASADGPSD
jgi:DNA-binding HxlR family transcriptional regulator